MPAEEADARTNPPPPSPIATHGRQTVNDTVVVITGAAALAPDVVTRIPPAAIVLAADGALDHALAAGLRPAGLIGDLDSVSADGLAWAEEHATVERHDPDKDHTDTELALRMAVGLDPAHLILVAGGGDRLDHTIAAIGALGDPSLTSIPLIDAWWGDQWIRIVHGPGRTSIDLAPGSTLSLLALHGTCTGVSITGTEWTLDGDDLAPVTGRGLSNVVVDDGVEISVSMGVLTVFLDPSPVPEVPT
jgi:thiamine pyrophosphokinase